MAVDVIGVGGVEPEPSRPDILFRKNCFTADGRSNCHTPTLDPNLVMRLLEIGNTIHQIMKLTIKSGSRIN